MTECHTCGRPLDNGDTAYQITIHEKRVAGTTITMTDRDVLICAPCTEQDEADQ